MLGNLRRDCEDTIPANTGQMNVVSRCHIIWSITFPHIGPTIGRQKHEFSWMESLMFQYQRIPIRLLLYLARVTAWDQLTVEDPT